MNQSTKASDGLIASVGGSVYPLSNSECIFRAKDTGERHVMTLEVLKAMDLCSRFRTFDNHVQVVMEGLNGLAGREDDTRRVLEALRQRGLFTSAENMLAAARQSEPRPRPELYDVFVRSNGRERALGVLLQSFLDNEARFGSRYRYYVLDDARSETEIKHCFEETESAKKAGLDCHWIGRERQTEFVDRLSRAAGVDSALAAWALNDNDEQAFTGGRLWNLITLMSAGRPFLMLDDDLVCNARRADGTSRIGLDSNYWGLWFHADAEEAGAWGEPATLDPLAAHAGVTGATVRQAFEALGTAPEDLAGLDQRQLARALETPILASASGMYGDAASSSKLWFYTATGESRERFWASREAYEQNVHSRYVSRSRTAFEFQAMSQFTPLGHAGQYMLPPTLPYGRNEDSLAAALRQSLYPESCSLEFPWALGHFPQEERQWSSEPWDQPYEENLARFIGACFLNATLPATGGDARHRYPLLADQLDAVTGDNNHALSARLDEFMLFARSDVIVHLQRALAGDTQVPVYWGADARRIIEVNGKALTQGGTGRLTEMNADMDAAQAAGWLRSRMAPYARLLRAWPDLWHAARDINVLPE